MNMKKSMRIMVGIVCGIPVATALACSIASLPIKPTKEQHIVEPTEEEKQKELPEGQTTTSYSLQLAEPLDSTKGQKIECSANVTEASLFGTTVNVTNVTTIGQAVSVNTEIVLPQNSNGNVWVKFNIITTCKNDDQTIVWTQTTTGFKQSATLDLDSHAITQESKVSKTSISCDKTKINSTDSVKLTINNTRSTPITDANLTIVVGNSTINTSIGEIAVGSQKYAEYNVSAINQLLQAAGKPAMSSNDSISFKLVRKGAYTVTTDNRLYQLNELNEPALVADTKIPENAFLVKNPETTDLVLSSKTFSRFIWDVPGTSADIWLLKGEFFNEGAGKSGAFTLNIHGIVDSQNNLLSSIRSYWKFDEQGYVHNYGVNYGDITLNLFNLKVAGRNGAIDQAAAAEGKSWSDISEGFMAATSTFTATDCTFEGAYCLWYASAQYTRCTFDSTKTWKESGGGTNYPMWIYSNAQARFDNCTFKSAGKAIKIYCTGGQTIVVNECRFELDQDYIITKTGKTPELKCPIDVGNNSTSSNIDIYYKNCYYQPKWQQQKTDFIKIDSSITSYIIVHQEDLPTE